MMNENWRDDNRRRKGSQTVSKNGGRGRQVPEGGRSFENGRSRDAGQSFGGRGGSPKKTGKEQGNDKGLNVRHRWTAPKLRSDPIPTPLCAYCNETIKDLAAALTDKNGDAIHFGCARKRIADGEPLGKGDTVTYIGGGRFGIVRFENPHVPGKFKIKKIIEWEEKDKRVPWRSHIADHFSLT